MTRRAQLKRRDRFARRAWAHLGLALLVLAQPLVASALHHCHGEHERAACAEECSSSQHASPRFADETGSISLRPLLERCAACEMTRALAGLALPPLPLVGDLSPSGGPRLIEGEAFRSSLRHDGAGPRAPPNSPRC